MSWDEKLNRFFQFFFSFFLSFPTCQIAIGSDRMEVNRGLVYLQYVDTTGCFVPRGQQKEVTQALVLGYLGFCEAAGFLRCQIFARQNPHYLFAGSEKNSEKKGLSAGQVRILISEERKKERKKEKKKKKICF